MSIKLALLLLFVSAVLEAGGDALVRMGLHSPLILKRAELILLGSIVLSSYGIVVNLPSWDFGRLLGVYVAMFFFVAQVINWLGFGKLPTAPILFGGTLIVLGGLIISFWRS
ncbi:MAG: hypothetical protein NVS2B14_17900 [Chamaesiphon sp.]